MKLLQSVATGSALILLAACQSTPANKAEPSLEATLQPVAEEPKAKAAKEETKTAKKVEIKTEQSAERVSYTPPPVGTRMVWKTSKGKLSPFSVVSLNSEFKGQKAIKYSTKLGFIFTRSSDGNRIGGTTQKGRDRFVVNPHNGALNFPLYVGKKWSHKYTFQRLDRARTGSRSFSATVEAWEDLQTPLGKLRTLRIKKKWSFGRGTSTSWYAPKLGLVVKDTYSSRIRNNGGELISYKRP